MGRLLSRTILGMFSGGCFLVGAAGAMAQATPSQSVVSTTSGVQPGNVQPASVQPTSEATPSATENSKIPLDPASLLPDLPSLPKAKASLIGGTIGKLDRVRDQITVQIFGGGKMKIAFDTRTHIYHDGAEASVSDLRQGDRIYVETILDGSTVFARNIRLKTSATTAGESQGIVISYSAGKGELQMRDALSPQTVKIRVTSQTRIVQDDRSVPASKLAAGTLVTVKFGPRQDGGEVAREVSVLAEPGAAFTFVGRVVAVDLRLGLLVLTSSVDHKTYEISFDPSIAGVDENLRPSADVTVLTRFEGNKYVARSLKVDAENQR